MKPKRLIAALLCLLLLSACGAPANTETPKAPVAPPDSAKTGEPAPNDAPAPPPDARP